MENELVKYEFGNRIDKELITKLPGIRYTGRITIVDTPEYADKVFKSLESFPMLGFDTESKPAFRKGVSYPVSILQLSNDNESFIIQLKKTGIRKSMADVLSNSEIKKIGVGIRDDIKDLQKLINFEPGGFVDLSEIAGSKGIIQTGVRGLAARYLGKRVSKSAQRTNWANPSLTRKQLLYAAIDAWVCLKIYPKLMADDRKYYEVEEVAEECGI